MNMKDFKDFLKESDSLSAYNKHKVQVTASKDGGPKEKIHVKVMATSEREAKGKARAHLHKKGYTTHSATHHGIDYDWLKKEEALCPNCGIDPCQCGEVVDEATEQIDELSRDTLKSYIGKSSKDMIERKRQQDIATARSKQPRLQGKYGQRSAIDTANWHAKAAEKRASGIGKAAMKIAKEEVEQVDELSNELLDRYKKKAGEAASAADKANDFEKGHKRFKGIVKATFKQFNNDAKK